MKLTRDNIIRILKSAIKRETVEDEVGREHRVKAEVNKAETNWAVRPFTVGVYFRKNSFGNKVPER